MKQEGSEICNVCRQSESRYTCPRCKMPYCSVACYRQHDADGSSCTESFYQDRVSTVLHYEAKEQSKSIQQILSRSHQVVSEGDFDAEEVSEEDLLRLAEALENGTITDENAERLLTPEMKLTFERAVKNGELSTMIDPWHPWWMPEFVSSEQSPSKNISVPSTTLDERLLKIPPFQYFWSGPLPALTYNTVDLLYSIALTLRLYHGVDNAITICHESCQTLIGTSAVLRDGARHTSVAEALMACTAPSTFAQDSSITHWTLLAQDVIYLCSSPRHLSHALLEAIDIVKATAKVMKNQGDTEDASRMRHVKKKLEYYLSWSREATLPGDLEDQIRAWIEEWNGLSDTESDTLLLPKMNESQRRQCAVETDSDGMPARSLMKEVSSKRKSG